MKAWQKLLMAGAIGVIVAAVLVGTKHDKWVREHLDEVLRKNGLI